MTPEDEARFHTGYDRQTHEPNVGIYIVRRQNGLLRIGFDLGKINANLRPSTIERLEARWRQEASTTLSKSLLRSALRRVHVAKSFVRFEIAAERIEDWKTELEAVLSNADSYEHIDRRIEANV